MARGVITLTLTQAQGLREAVRPLASIPHDSGVNPTMLILFCEKVLMVLVEFETGVYTTRDLELTREDCLFINQFLSMQDGGWAQDVLRQARRALYELRTGVLPAWKEDNAKIAEMVKGEDSGDTGLLRAES